MEEAYPCIMDLIAKTKRPATKERAQQFEKVMTEGVIRGLTYAGYKLRHLKALLSPVERLYIELGSLGVRYLNVSIHWIYFLGVLCSHVNRELYLL